MWKFRWDSITLNVFSWNVNGQNIRNGNFYTCSSTQNKCFHLSERFLFAFVPCKTLKFSQTPKKYQIYKFNSRLVSDSHIFTQFSRFEVLLSCKNKPKFVLITKYSTDKHLQSDERREDSIEEDTESFKINWIAFACNRRIINNSSAWKCRIKKAFLTFSIYKICEPIKTSQGFKENFKQNIK